ncbi:2-hydroxyacid dehydrogenase family protein [Paramaledivibacter caminithermalis]|jgi:D-3-phosphoglycerate dehydrogenase|uniref:D-3-phosphoglycerate dehydrogenase n=1 Tax=Paramaledivibacter caminithermalis (strain DSM 15212 / CIP 107654 / DViRD3) TaxID=1121301 RepID=A0A1M6S429_PARC5|nr:2-hydroxyacid dehydrogenase family protein [Paramaledivibacter caminithermalis]SHK39441.1 D-3-phosphoglycerate dehydrogenase [Paramaledivibacter caminithermalis DSM 15212]
MKQRVFISGKIPKTAYDILSKEFEVTMHDDIRLLSKGEIMEGIKGKDALLCLLSDPIDKEIIDSNPNLKIIANYGAGFNNIDIEAATSNKIPVTNTPLVSTTSTAELTMGLILSIARRIVEGDKITRAGKFTGWAPLYHLGTELSSKTLGIIGLGNIGKAVAKRAKAFDMNIIYYTNHPLDENEEKKLGYKYMSLDKVIENSDFLTLHLSYSPSSFHMIGREQLEKMKSTAYLINAARGPLVDETALLEALKNKSIAGAALDVYEREPEITAGLEKLDNVILTPHIGNATIEARNKMAEVAANNIIAVLNGQKPINCVNPDIYE